ncbi:GntR family transcriptional regulator [Pseudomonas sp. LB-090624]|uniref:LysR family transcriptional regulator n=1 Tax=Pseudomonas sp. LB-090624 TaxID=2213079 RepID=UPI000D8BB788|nr:LysR family transcriptional regulator [Pseudomonas sp. LB-090624]PYB78910.1 GntR family transcriptional regulator [Pseudomonas sp. LB-090624]
MNLLQIDLLSLRLLVFAAETLNLTQAASRANMTLSTASKRISELERITDCALFVRLPRGMEITAAGRAIADHARQVLESVNRMAYDVNDFAMGVRGHVRLTANTSAVVQFLPQDLASYLAQNPLIRIGMEEALSDDIVAAVLDGRSDIGIFADNVSSEGLVKQVYRRDELVLLVPRGHPLATHQEASLATALDYDFVALNQGSSLLRRLTDAAVANGKMLKVRIQVSSFDGICRMIEAGLGIGVLPFGSVRQELLGSRLEAVRLTDEWAKRTLFVGVASEANLSPEASKLYDYLARMETRKDV